MYNRSEDTTLMDLIESIENMEKEASRVSVDDVVSAVGRRSFGLLLLVAGLITLAPIIGDIPGMPTLMAVLVLLGLGLVARDGIVLLPGLSLPAH